MVKREEPIEIPVGDDDGDDGEWRSVSVSPRWGYLIALGCCSLSISVALLAS